MIKRKVLFIDIIGKGKVIYKTSISYVSKKLANAFIKSFDDNDVNEIKSLEMEQL